MVTEKQLAKLCIFGYKLSVNEHITFPHVPVEDYIKAVMQQNDINTVVPPDILQEIEKHKTLVLIECHPTQDLRIRIVHYSKQLALEEAYKQITQANAHD